MSIAKPSGKYADEMLEPGGWVEVGEQSLYDRAQEYMQILRQMTSSLEGLQHERGEIFDGGIFEGTAANAAKVKLDEVIDEFTCLQQHLVSAITWYQNAGDTVARTKSAIADRVHSAQQQISELESNSDGESDDEADAIQSVINKTHSDNARDIASAAVSVPTTGSWTPPANALQILLNQKSPPLAANPGGAPSAPAGPQRSGAPGHVIPKSPSTGLGQAPAPTSGQFGALGGPGLPQPARQDDVSAAVAAPASGVPGKGTVPALSGGGGSQGGAPVNLQSGVSGKGTVPALSGGGGSQGGAPVNLQSGVPGKGSVPALSGGGGSQGGAPVNLQSARGAPEPPPPASSPTNPGINPNDFMGPVTGGLGGVAGGSGGGGGDGHGGSGVMGSMLNNAFGAQQGGQQNPFSAEAFEHHREHQELGLQQAANQAAVNNAAGSAASAATNAAAQVPLSAAAPMAPAAAHGPTAAELSAAAAPSGGGVVSGGGSAGGAVSGSMSSAESSVSSMPLLPPATPHAAAPVSVSGAGGAANTGSGGPGVHPASTTSVGRSGFGGSAASSQAEAAPAPIPVSAARAEKDAIAEATRRQSSADVRAAYRIAAALNADDMVSKADFNFFWLTAVSADGQIVVANSYGLGYVPEAVALPAQVSMASADASIPVRDRARWTTYPSIALQGWAAHHDTTLRVVIGKEQHFTGIDPGVPKQFVADEDIPTRGKMDGRSRLEVLAPADAARLATASDVALIDLLPPAPVDTAAPADQRNTLWFDVIKHLMSSDPDRGARQLEAFATYAAHAQGLLLHRAHCAVHAVEQRAAVADWLYWHHLYGLLGEAMAREATA